MDSHFKDCSPEETIQRIKDILQKYDIEVEEQFRQKDETIGTCSSRITIKNTAAGTNGKGISETYCNASAYAEFMERLQNNIIFGGNEIRIPMLGKKFYIESDERLVTTETIIDENCSALQEYFKMLNMNEASRKEKIEYYQELLEIESMMVHEKDMHVTVPFYNFKRNKVEYVPALSCFSMYGSNGMSAGNTFEEAIVQGISEIIERYVQYKVMKEKLCLPNVPEKEISKYPYINKMYTNIKEKGMYDVFIKDASLGGIYPVAALVLIEKDTGRYGVKFGCHPDFGIAMERAFTETTQGRTLEQYSQLGYLDFKNRKVDLDFNTLAGFQTGEAQFPYQFFGTKFDYEYTPVRSVEGKGNFELAKEWIEELIAKGYDVLIRDSSKLGFPSCRIIIPGLSSINLMTEKKIRAVNTRLYLVDRLRNLEDLTVEDCRYVIAVIKTFEEYKGEVAISKFFPDKYSDYFPGEDIFAGGHYLAGMCSLFCEDYEKASYFLDAVYRVACCSNISEDKKKFYLAVSTYAEAMNELKSHEEVMNYLNLFFSKYICELLDDYFCEPHEILKKLYRNALSKENIHVIKGIKKVYTALMKAEQENPISQENLKNVFKVN